MSSPASGEGLHWGGGGVSAASRPVSPLPFPPGKLSIVVSVALTNQRLQLVRPQLVGYPPLSAGCDAGCWRQRPFGTCVHREAKSKAHCFIDAARMPRRLP